MTKREIMQRIEELPEGDYERLIMVDQPMTDYTHPSYIEYKDWLRVHPSGQYEEWWMQMPKRPVISFTPKRKPVA